MLIGSKKEFNAFGFYMQAAFWLMLLSFVLYSSVNSLGWQNGGIRSISIIICHLINFYGCYNFLTPKYFEQKKYKAAAIGLLLLLLFLTPVRYLIEIKFPVSSSVAPFRHLKYPSKIGLVMFSEIAIISFAGLLRLAVNYETNKIQMAELSQLQSETQLRFLKAQTSPHFLFNAINNIYSLTLVKSDKASEALMKLSDLLRYLLYESKNKMPIKSEIETIKTYAELFQLKYEQPVNLIIQSSINNNCLIESSLLLPLFENAVKHSGLGVQQDAYVFVGINEVDYHVTIKISNSIADVKNITEASGIGLNNIINRLQMVYKNKHDFNIFKDENNFIVTLKIELA